MNSPFFLPVLKFHIKNLILKLKLVINYYISVVMSRCIIHGGHLLQLSTMFQCTVYHPLVWCDNAWSCHPITRSMVSSAWILFGCSLNHPFISSHISEERCARISLSVAWCWSSHFLVTTWKWQRWWCVTFSWEWPLAFTECIGSSKIYSILFCVN